MAQDATGAASRISFFTAPTTAGTMVERLTVLANGKVAAQGTPHELRQTTDPLIHQFVNGLSDGPVHFHYPATSVAEDFGRAAS